MSDQTIIKLLRSENLEDILFAVQFLIHKDRDWYRKNFSTAHMVSADYYLDETRKVSQSSWTSLYTDNTLDIWEGVLGSIFVKFKPYE